MAIEVIHPGLLATIQDTGRYGMQKYGVVVSGAQDIFSLKLANILVGNDQHEAGIEIAMYGSSYRFTDQHLVAITGADLQVKLDGELVPLWRPFLVEKGSELVFTSAKQGCYAYMAIAGGFQIEEVYASKSTYLRAKMGGLDGEALKKKDYLPIGPIQALQEEMIRQLSEGKRQPSWFVKYDHILPFARTESLLVLPASERDFFTEKSLQAFTETEYMLTMRADRMGYAFQGRELKRKEEVELLSEGVTFGTIQVPSSGQPIVLMADRQTTGGYPKIGQVISAHLPRLAQLKPKQFARFTFTSIEEAEKAYVEMDRYIRSIEETIAFRIRTHTYAK